jgi:hypothetical protein
MEKLKVDNEEASEKIEEFRYLIYRKLDDSQYVVAPAGPLGPKYCIYETEFEDFTRWLFKNHKGGYKRSQIIIACISFPLIILFYGKLSVEFVALLGLIVLPLIISFGFYSARKKIRSFKYHFPNALRTHMSIGQQP